MQTPVQHFGNIRSLLQTPDIDHHKLYGVLWKQWSLDAQYYKDAVLPYIKQFSFGPLKVVVDIGKTQSVFNEVQTLFGDDVEVSLLFDGSLPARNELIDFELFSKSMTCNSPKIVSVCFGEKYSSYSMMFDEVFWAKMMDVLCQLPYVNKASNLSLTETTISKLLEWSCPLEVLGLCNGMLNGVGADSLKTIVHFGGTLSLSDVTITYDALASIFSHFGIIRLENVSIREFGGQFEPKKCVTKTLSLIHSRDIVMEVASIYRNNEPVLEELYFGNQGSPSAGMFFVGFENAPDVFSKLTTLKITGEISIYLKEIVRLYDENRLQALQTLEYNTPFIETGSDAHKTLSRFFGVVDVCFGLPEF